MTNGTNLPLISVIIPTFNRSAYLHQSLRSLVKQSIPQKNYEVIVIDDGSSDQTRNVCNQMRRLLPLRYFYQRNSGIAAAKNLGIFTSRAPILFFFDDDDVADKNLLREHLRSHNEHPDEKIAVLGYTAWSPKLKITPVMHYVTNVGHLLFSYSHLVDGQILDFTYFWGGRSSCKRSLLVRHGIHNQAFRLTQDIELGYRLSKVGLKVVFNQRAVSFMIRPVSYDDFCKRCEGKGRFAALFDQLHPDPVIHKYCKTRKAEEKWAFAEKNLARKVERVRELENTLRAVHDHGAGNGQLDELHKLYRWTFEAFRLKGIVQERQSRQSAACLPSPQTLCAGDRDYLDTKWGDEAFTLPKVRTSILVCDPLLPMFDRASGSLRLFHILKALVQLGYHVTFISRDSDHAERYVPILRDLGIETYAGDPSAKEHAGALIIAPFVDLEGILRERPYRAAILSFWHLAEYYLPLIRRYSPDTTVIVDSVDIHFLREIREAELKGDEHLKARALENKEREITVYGNADRVWVVTPDDRKAIESLIGDVPIDVIPNIHERIGHRKTYEETADLLFVGNFNHRPNIDSVEFLCDEILPLLQTELPGVKTYIVGNNPPEAVKKRASDRIIVTGYVEHIAPYLKNARISVSPLRYGAGMKGKVGEALSWGLPVVTTSIGAEGMGLVDGHDALIADDAGEFVSKVIRLYNDAELWNRLSANGKRTVESQWSPEAIQKRLALVLRDIDRRNEKVSIVILTFNELEYTKRCVESIRRHTPEPHEIVFVDNGSTDGTVKWLRQLIRDNPGYRLIENRENLGFARGCNQGIETASGEYVLLLNNDTVVTEEWLSGMMDCLRSVPDAGIVGPMTNHISGIQKVDTADCDAPEGLEDYARDFRRRNLRRRIETRRLVGFCMLFRKSLIDEIGPLDESFGTGNFEDDDLCARAALAGYRNVIAGDVFIHHVGSRSFIGNRIDYGSAMTGNRRIYAGKWRALEQEAEEGRKIRSLVARERARERFLRGDLQAAVDLWLAVIRDMPEDHRAYHEMAGGLIRAKRYREALEVLTEAPASPAPEERLILEGQCREGLDDLDAAEEFAAKALSVRVDCSSALNLKGVIAFRRGAAEQARECFEKAVEADPSFGEPHTNLGVLAWAEGRHDEAFELLERGFILTPCDSDLAERYHAAAVAIEAQARAERAFREARSLYPASRTIAFLLIDLLLSQGRFEEAMARIEDAMDAFEADDGFIAAALAVREKIGPHGAGRRPGVSLCMIVKNEEKNVVRCLRSVKPVVDEIVVVDTGSTDRTRELCRVLGAKVHDHPWTEDFSAARNVSLEKASGDWVLVLDADEALSQRDYPTLRKAARKAPKKPRAFTMETRNYLNLTQQTGWRANVGEYPAEEAGSGWFPSEKVRLFSRDARIRFENPVHEIVEPSLRRLGVKPERLAVPVHHYGKLDAEKAREKGEAYYALGRKKLEQGNGDVESLRELAVQAMELGRVEEALDLWTRVAELRPDMARAHVNLAHIHLEHGRYPEALESARKALALDPGMKEAGLNCALGEFYAGDIAETVRILEALLERIGAYPAAAGLLAAARIVRGERDQALDCIEELRRQGFGDLTFLRECAAKLECAGRIPEAAALLSFLGPAQADDPVPGTPVPTETDRAATPCPSLSLCMIARDEEAVIGRALSSVREAVSEMIVVDTGSKDRTREIALEKGATVFDFPWCDDFAAARNFALSKATGEWILVLDADEALSPADAMRLSPIVQEAPDDIAGYLILTRNYSAEMNTEGWTRNDGRYAAEEEGPGWYPSTKVRLFRNDPRIRYAGAVHEMIEPALTRHGFRWVPCDVTVHHYGPLAGRSKGEMYYRLGHKKLAEAGDPRALYELAVQAGRLRRFDEAIDLWERYLSLGSTEDLPLAHLNLGHAFLETGRYGSAADACARALALDPGLKEASLNLAMAEFYEGRLEEAAGRLETLLARTGDYPPAAALFCAACLVTGKSEKAEARIRALSAQDINPAAFFQVYASRLRASGRTDEAETLLETARRLWEDELRTRGLENGPGDVAQVMSAVEAEIPPVQTACDRYRRGESRLL